MILLLKVDVNNSAQPLSEVFDPEEYIGVDAWSVVTVEKFYFNGGSEGSKVFLAEGRGFITVREVMTDVIHSVELEISRSLEDDDG